MSEQTVTIFINWLILHAAGLTSQVAFFDQCFKRRHGMAVWIVYFGTRGVIRAYMSAVMGSGNMGPALLTFNIIFVLITAVASFAVLWYTWDAEPLKIGITGIIIDLMTGTAMVIVISTANYAAGNGFISDMTILTTLETAAAGVGFVLLVLIMIRLLRPAIRWFRAVEFRHRRILAAIVIIGAAGFSSTNLTDTARFDLSAVVVCLTGALFLAPLAIYVTKTIDIQRNRRVLLRQQAEMDSAYMIAVENQNSMLASHRQLLDAVSSRIEASDSSLNQDMLRSYIADLRNRADALKSGSYSSNIAVDAVMTSFAGRFRTLGYEVEFRTDRIDSDDTRAAEICWIMLNWAERAAGPADGEVLLHSDESTPGMISFFILHRSDQLLFCLSIVPVIKSRFPDRLLKAHISRYDVIEQNCSGGKYELNVMTGTKQDGPERKEADQCRS